jgi:hypothetical protein
MLIVDVPGSLSWSRMSEPGLPSVSMQLRVLTITVITWPVSLELAPNPVSALIVVATLGLMLVSVPAFAVGE